jgi:hypothetical protein
MENEYRDISWSISFEVCINGEEARFFEDLTEDEQQEILKRIEEGYYHGSL